MPESGGRQGFSSFMAARMLASYVTQLTDPTNCAWTHDVFRDHLLKPIGQHGGRTRDLRVISTTL